MSDIPYAEQSKRANLSWTTDAIFHPFRAFRRITATTTNVWLIPLALLSVAVVISVIVAGNLKHQAELTGEITYPPDFQYYTPEQQAQFMQAIQSTQGPVFTYVLPGITSLLGVWLGWLILGGLVHLVTTLFGGRGSTAISMNIVAWASLPLVLRELVQIIYMLVEKKIITSPGLSGFIMPVESGLSLFLYHLVSLIDIYLIWQILLIILGIRISMGLTKTKATASVVISILVILLLKAGLSYLIGALGNLNITRPFFF